MKDVIAQINPDQKGDSANVLRSFYMDLQKAKKIIENVESGSFPEEPQFWKIRTGFLVITENEG